MENYGDLLRAKNFPEFSSVRKCVRARSLVYVHVGVWVSVLLIVCECSGYTVAVHSFFPRFLLISIPIPRSRYRFICVASCMNLFTLDLRFKIRRINFWLLFIHRDGIFRIIFKRAKIAHGKLFLPSQRSSAEERKKMVGNARKIHKHTHTHTTQRNTAQSDQ